MLEVLKHQFYEVMRKYDLPFGEKGVEANLKLWQENKAELLQLLRRHPNWNEQELAIVFDVAEEREIDHDVVDQAVFELEELAREALPLSEQEMSDFRTALNAAVSDYARIPDASRLDTIRQYGHIKCSVGQKASRIINKICLRLGLEQYSVEKPTGEQGSRQTRRVVPYYAAFARLADALNPIAIHKKAILSIHPCDFLEMSNKDDTWRSCHCLDHGGYRGGCLSYLGDKVSMIFFTVDDNIQEKYYRAPRLTREIFAYQDGLLLQSRLYPNGNEDTKVLYREVVQNAMATCLREANLWTIKKVAESDASRYCETEEGALHYPDYAYGYAVASILKGRKEPLPMRIGIPSRCTCCGEVVTNHRQVKCDTCEATTVCAGCGATIKKDGAYAVDGNHYCSNCAYICAKCGTMGFQDGRPAVSRRGIVKKLCPQCYEQAAMICGRCGIHRICRSIAGGQYCPYTDYDVEAA